MGLYGNSHYRIQQHCEKKNAGYWLEEYTCVTPVRILVASKQVH